MGRNLDWKLETAFIRVLFAKWLLPKEFEIVIKPQKQTLVIEGDYSRV